MRALQHACSLSRQVPGDLGRVCSRLRPGEAADLRPVRRPGHADDRRGGRPGVDALSYGAGRRGVRRAHPAAHGHRLPAHCAYTKGGRHGHLVVAARLHPLLAGTPPPTRLHAAAPPPPRLPPTQPHANPVRVRLPPPRSTHCCVWPCSADRASRHGPKMPRRRTCSPSSRGRRPPCSASSSRARSCLESS
jgi:hypothetical protein